MTTDQNAIVSSSPMPGILDAAALNFLDKERLRRATMLPTRLRPRLGTAVSRSHVGELIQGAIRLPGLPEQRRDHRLPDEIPDAARCLIDLTAPVFRSMATVTVIPGSGAVHSHQKNKRKAAAAAKLLLQAIQIDGEVDVSVNIETNIPEGRGLGSSSCDVRSTLLALAEALDCSMPVEMIDFLTVLAEQAANPAANVPTLFFHRLGVTGMRAARFPSMTVVPFDDATAADVITDKFEPAAYTAAQVDTFEILVRAAFACIRHGDARGLGELAVRSAEINDEFLPRCGQTSLPTLHRIKRATDAAGFAVSHSGTVGAFLYDRSDTDLESRIGRSRAMLSDLGCTVFETYSLD